MNGEFTKTALLSLLLMSLAPGALHTVSAKECSAKMEHATCRCPVELLHPTQMAVGMIQVAAKVEQLKKKKKKGKLSSYLKEHPEPVTIGPQGVLFITDHHHLAVALLNMGIDETYCQAAVRIVLQLANRGENLGGIMLILSGFDTQMLARIDAAAQRLGISRTAWLHLAAGDLLEADDDPVLGKLLRLIAHAQCIGACGGFRDAPRGAHKPLTASAVVETIEPAAGLFRPGTGSPASLRHEINGDETCSA
jgi:hypothetical protein